MAQIIYSKLMKADYLNGSSLVFPVLVRAACAYAGITYTERVKEHAATYPPILDALEMTQDTNLDAVLWSFAYDEGAAAVMDGLLLAAVNQYKEQHAEA